MAKKRNALGPNSPLQVGLFKELLPEKSAKEMRDIQRSLPVTRKRNFTFTSPSYKEKQTYPNDGSITHEENPGTPVAKRTGTQITVSEGHPWPPRKGSPLRDLGGDFTTTKQYIIGIENAKIFRLISRKVYSPSEIQTDTYAGPIFPAKVSDPALCPFPPDGSSSDSLLNQKGATAIARCKPTNSVADVATFLGETLRDGLPSLLGSQTWKARTHRAKAHSLGGEFLNVVFGWLPLVADVKKFAKAVEHANTVLEQYERDSGRVVRRQYHFPTETHTENIPVTNQLGPFLGTTFASTNWMVPPYVRTVILTRETVKRQWFSGAFTYHIPTGSDSRQAMIRHALDAKKLLGIELTPTTLWEMTPWSWAIDWFSNTGDVVSNLTDWKTDGLVLRYGYIMEHTVVRDTYSLESSPISGVTSIPPVTFVTETKKRRRANPFGFGISWDGLSPIQLAIAAALGISRSG